MHRSHSRTTLVINCVVFVVVFVVVFIVVFIVFFFVVFIVVVVVLVFVDNDDDGPPMPTPPISLGEGKRGEWDKVFITLSSRLIYLVWRIFIPRPHEGGVDGNVDNNDGGKFKFEDFWVAPDPTDLPRKTGIWEDL